MYIHAYIPSSICLYRYVKNYPKNCSLNNTDFLPHSFCRPGIWGQLVCGCGSGSFVKLQSGTGWGYSLIWRLDWASEVHCQGGALTWLPRWCWLLARACVSYQVDLSTGCSSVLTYGSWLFSQSEDPRRSKAEAALMFFDLVSKKSCSMTSAISCWSYGQTLMRWERQWPQDEEARIIRDHNSGWLPFHKYVTLCTATLLFFYK